MKINNKDKDRGTGRTKAQMLNAPKGALFIWPFEGSLYYPKKLAKHINRDDLKIIGLAHLENSSLYGRTYTGVILDHAAYLSEEHYRQYQHLLPLVR